MPASRIIPILILCFLFSSGMGSAPGKDILNAKSPAPDFMLKAIDGKTYTLSETAKDHIVVISFFASWCPPCRAEIPHLIEFAKESEKRPVKVWLINVNENEKTVKNFMQDYKTSIPVLLDTNGDVADRYQVSGIPTLFVIDKAGQIAKKTVGFDPKIKKILEEEINFLLE
jgi:peroxiredoxin